MRRFWLMIWSYAIIGLSLSQWAEENSSYTFALLRLQVGVEFIAWRKNVNSVTVISTSCYVKTMTCGVTPNSLSVNITLESGTIQSMLTIHNVTRELHNSVWESDIKYPLGYPTRTQYTLKVYATPENPVCDNAILINRTHIQIKCVTERVYPDALCTFYTQTNKSHTVLLSSGSINYKSGVANTTGYNRTECTYTISAVLLGPGSHFVYVIMHPNFPSNITENMKRSSQFTVPIEILYPKAVLAPDCHFDEFIKENETRTCTCENDNPSFLPTDVQWNVDGNSNSILRFTAQRPSSNVFQIFKCTIVNSLNWTATITYQPHVAYPPTLNLSLPKRDMDICDEKLVNVLGNCLLTPSFPKPSVQVYINNVLLVGNLQTNTNEYTFNVTVTSPGIFNVTCFANNRAFLVHIATSLFIKGPPEKPTILKLANDEASSPENMRQSVIMCQSRGGYPYSKKLSLACDSVETWATNSDNVILYVNMTHTPTDVSCTCVVWHESKCLQNKTTEKLTVSFLRDPSLGQVSEAAIGVGVALTSVIIVLIIIIIVIMRRHKRTNRNQQTISKTNNKQEYNNSQATTPYINIDMQAYETPNTKNARFSNEELPTTSINRGENSETSLKQAKKEEHLYEEVKGQR
ncbi:unnamed protein product [Lymnaea stagnalis]|uniref:Ig-like domain-containing protein n=1 Tax=Lymnaea stagnalis TaxID=6523 RepID=A0AAV2I3F7_LYMST